MAGHWPPATHCGGIQIDQPCHVGNGPRLAYLVQAYLYAAAALLGWLIAVALAELASPPPLPLSCAVRAGERQE